MIDPLSAIFKDGLFQTKKSPDRDWMMIAERSGGRIYGIVCEEFAHPEVALCALIHSMGEVILCQPDQSRRDKLLKAIPGAIQACIESLEKMESDEPYEFEGDDQSDDQDDPPGKPGDPGQEEEEVDPESEADFKTGKMTMEPNQPGLPEPEDDDVDWNGDEEDRPWKRPAENPSDKPARLAGFKRKGKGKGEQKP
jgi:hypothetical protein